MIKANLSPITFPVSMTGAECWYPQKGDMFSDLQKQYPQGDIFIKEGGHVLEFNPQTFLSLCREGVCFAIGHQAAYNRVVGQVEMLRSSLQTTIYMSDPAYRPGA